MNPTKEQLEALDLFSTGENLVIEAGAGTGKTSTLILLAESTKKLGHYIAFNKSIVEESRSKMPANITSSTAHSLAYRAVGARYKKRLNGPRLKSAETAKRLGITAMKVDVGGESKRLAAGFLAAHVMRAIGNFCKTADAEPTRSHFSYLDGIDLPTEDGRRTYGNNNEVQAMLEPALRKAWADLNDLEGQLRFGHDIYLKMWQLSNPRIASDFILFDEAQDANPVMKAIVLAQTHAQLVFVGDSQQQIYEFTGAVNALADLDGNRTFLTQSFRFGPGIAAVANDVLAMIEGAELRLTGLESIVSTLLPAAKPDAILCRTNAEAMTQFLRRLSEGEAPHLIGGGREIKDFALGCQSLKNDGWTSHAELACFSTWAEVQDYVENDPEGGDLKLMVTLMDDFGPEAILAGLRAMPSEDAASVVISTAHKSKGREWDSVQIAGDFPDGEEREASDPELRLLYVALTRARKNLDPWAAPLLLKSIDKAAEEG